jgi:hypothetical protein
VDETGKLKTLGILKQAVKRHMDSATHMKVEDYAEGLKVTTRSTVST